MKKIEKAIKLEDKTLKKIADELGKKSRMIYD